MKVIFSKVTYLEVKEKEIQALREANSLSIGRELFMHYSIKRVPFIVAYWIYLYFILNECSLYVFKFIYNLIQSFYIKVNYAQLLSGMITLGIIAITLICSYKGMIFGLNRVLPPNTPNLARKRQIKGFLCETEKIKNALSVMNNIKLLSPNDIAYSELMIEEDSNMITLFLKDSQNGYITKYTYKVLRMDMMQKIINSGELDFTYMDEEWNNLLHKYQFIQ